MSARSRSRPWFRETGERYTRIVDAYERERHEPVAMFAGTMKVMVPRHVADALAVLPDGSPR